MTRKESRSKNEEMRRVEKSSRELANNFLIFLTVFKFSLKLGYHYTININKEITHYHVVNVCMNSRGHAKYGARQQSVRI